MHGDRNLGGVDVLAGHGERPRRGQLEVAREVVVAPLQVRNPDSAIDGGAADRAAPLRDDRARLAAEALLGMCPEQMEFDLADPVENAGRPLGRADPAEDRGGAV